MRAVDLLVVTVGVFSLVACSSASAPSMCSGASSSTLTVTFVNDSCEPSNVCNATVVAKGPATVTLTPSGGTSHSTCDYVGTVRAGTYAITATAPTYQPGTGHVTVAAGCDSSVEILATMVP